MFNGNVDQRVTEADMDVWALMIALSSFLVAGLALAWQVYTQMPRYRVSAGFNLVLEDGFTLPTLRVENLGGRPFAVNSIGAADTEGDVLIADLPLVRSKYPFKTLASLPTNVGPGDTVQWAFAFARPVLDVRALRLHVALPKRTVIVDPNGLNSSRRFGRFGRGRQQPTLAPDRRPLPPQD